jgi:hypothetical protein
LNKGDIFVILTSIVFVATYLSALFELVPQIKFISSWPDAFFYIWINVFLGKLWWKHKLVKQTDVDRLSLASSVMGGTIQAAITATSIFIPLSLAAIELGLTSNISFLTTQTLRHLIIAVAWFGLSTVIGLVALVYINELMGEDRYILRERRIGIATNLQLYAIIVGVLRITYALILIWGSLNLGLG